MRRAVGPGRSSVLMSPTSAGIEFCETSSLYAFNSSVGATRWPLRVKMRMLPSLWLLCGAVFRCVVVVVVWCCVSLCCDVVLLWLLYVVVCRVSLCCDVVLLWLLYVVWWCVSLCCDVVLLWCAVL